MEPVRLTPGVTIPAEEIELSFVRASGPGGQRVNTTATKVQLRFDVGASRALDDAARERILSRLGHRLTEKGVLVLAASTHRSQSRNRDEVLTRFANLLRDALGPDPSPRRPTRPSRRARERRLAGKRAQAEKKRLRRPPPS